MRIILASESFNLLAANPGLVFWTVVTFLTVLIILWLFAWKPIIQAIDARNDKIEGELKESQRLREESEKLLRDYESKMKEAQTETMRLIGEGKKEAEETRAKILKKAEKENSEIKARMKQEIEQAKISAVQEIQESMVNMTIQVISKIFKKDVDDKTHKELIMNELKEISILNTNKNGN